MPLFGREGRGIGIRGSIVPGRRGAAGRVAIGILAITLASSTQAEAQRQTEDLTYDWPWGELVYDRVYETSIEVVNECRTAENVSIEVEDLPLVSLPPHVTVPAFSSIDLPVRIETPPGPDPATLVPPPGIVPADYWDSIFLDIDGTVVLDHPWKYYGDDESCGAVIEVYDVTAHVHLDPDPPSGGGGGGPPWRMDACQVWWNTGEPPPDVEGDCTERFRALALHWLDHVVGPLAETDPEAWAWLPSATEILGMSAEELIAMKKRADAQMAGAAA